MADHDKEIPVSFHSTGLKLCGLLHRGSGDRVAVITHPHPLYGGNMYNPVVATIARAYWSGGYSTLRFDFRGTGESQGEYAGGREEPADVAAAMEYLAGTGAAHIDLAGYSFGAWINALSADGLRITGRMIMISPPVAFLDFTTISALPALALVVTGSEDEFAPPGMIEALMPSWNRDARLHIIDSADHFYSGFDRELERAVREAIIQGSLPRNFSKSEGFL